MCTNKGGDDGTGGTVPDGNVNRNRKPDKGEKNFCLVGLGPPFPESTNKLCPRRISLSTSGALIRSSHPEHSSLLSTPITTEQAVYRLGEQLSQGDCGDEEMGQGAP